MIKALRQIFIATVALQAAFLSIASASDKILGGNPIEGGLEVTVRDNASIGVRQYRNGAFEDRTGGSLMFKGSHLFINGSSCGLGYPSTAGQGGVPSNAISGNTIFTRFDCPGLSITFEQEVTYAVGSQTIQYLWRITNTSASELTDLRFFHVSDNDFPYGGPAQGIVNPANKRRATFYNPISDLSLPVINLPRKVIVSNGVFLETDGSFVANLVWQDIRKGLLTRQATVAGSIPVSVGRVALRSSLLQSEYIYRTAR